MTTILTKSKCIGVFATDGVQGKTIGNLNIPPLLDYRIKTIYGLQYNENNCWRAVIFENI